MLEEVHEEININILILMNFINEVCPKTNDHAIKY